MHIVTTKTCHPAPVHYALHKIVSLHAILVCCAVRVVRKCCFTQGVFLKPPKVAQVKACMVPDRPVIVLAFDRNGQGTSLRMTLNTGIACGDIIHARRVQNVAARWMLHMLTARSVAFFAANVPLSDLLGEDVVVDGVTSIAGWTCGPLHIVRRIKGLPPVSPLSHEIRPPDSMDHIPLCGFREVIVSSPREVTLFPEAAVNPGELVLREFGNGIRRKIGNDGIGMLTRITNHIRHGCFSPVFVDLPVALLTGL